MKDKLSIPDLSQLLLFQLKYQLIVSLIDITGFS